jgi:hypothetical protein
MDSTVTAALIAAAAAIAVAIYPRSDWRAAMLADEKILEEADRVEPLKEDPRLKKYIMDDIAKTRDASEKVSKALQALWLVAEIILLISATMIMATVVLDQILAGHGIWIAFVLGMSALAGIIGAYSVHKAVDG